MLFIGSCPLNAVASEDQKAKSAAVDSHDGACVFLLMLDATIASETDQKTSYISVGCEQKGLAHTHCCVVGP